jgi:hypothetical protein
MRRWNAAFDLPKIISGSPVYLAASLVVALIVKYVVESVAARRRTFRTEAALQGRGSVSLSQGAVT